MLNFPVRILYPAFSRFRLPVDRILFYPWSVFEHLWQLAVSQPGRIASREKLVSVCPWQFAGKPPGWIATFQKPASVGLRQNPGLTSGRTATFQPPPALLMIPFGFVGMLAAGF